MQVTADNFKLFSNLIKDSKNVVILMDKNQTMDVFSTSLFFENVLAGGNKKAMIVTKAPIPESLNHLRDKFINKIEPPKLVVSFNWHKNAIDKISYNMEGENFNFIVTPKDKKIKPEEINFSYKGKEIDLVITLGLTSLNNLQDYEREYLQRKTIINIDNKSENQMFGSVNIVNEKADALCSVVTDAVEKSGFSITPNQAEILLSGLREATGGFTRIGDAYTFEAAAYCTKIQKGENNKTTEQILDKTQVPVDWLSPKVFRSNREAS